MDNEQKKRILKSYVPLLKELKKIEDEIIYWRSKSTRFGGSVIKFSKGSRVNRTEEAYDKLELLDYRFSDKIIRLSEIRNRIEDGIEKLEDPLHRVLMRMRYVEGRSWEFIAVEMSYGWAQVHRLHSIALKCIRFDT